MLVDHLRRQGDHVAVLTESEQLSYLELAEKVEAVARALGPRRRLILLETHNNTETLVRYLGALAGEHVVLPVPRGRDHSAMIETYQPDVVIDASGLHVRTGCAHRLHDELALLMSTSGSTGSPKLVRLSRTNLTTNAAAIAGYLGIRKTDRAATTLPMSYCYGLSVVHSHLLAGAAVILTEQSVADPGFWDLFRRHRGTTFAGVPYTFELLEQVGFESMDLPHLRYLTQAGGRMPPERVREFARLADRQGWQLFVMYGATEATARMAYLPPDLARDRPTAIGRPIPGGSFSINAVDDWPDGTGELVFRGPNVMMGYAQQPLDLTLGATVNELPTGDIARRGHDGLYEIIGRRNRFMKIYGLRIDLAQLETTLRTHGVRALCIENDERLAVVAEGDGDRRDLQRLAARAAGVPVAAVTALRAPQLPMLASGKPDYLAARAMARDQHATGAAASEKTDLRTLFADALQLDPAEIDLDASFVDLGGNSLSYVMTSVRLERALGQLPPNWPQVSLRELNALPKPQRNPRTPRTPWTPWTLWGSTLETSVALRAAAIVLIVGSHADVFKLWGGAHILLGVAGYNFGRFCLTPVSRPARVRHLRTTIAWIAVPSALWIAIALVLTDDYQLSNLLLANKFLGPHDSMTAGRLWFIEVLVWTLIALTLLFWIPAMDRFERRNSFALATAFLAFGMALRFDVLGLGLGDDAWFTVLTFWFFAAGWAAAKATTNRQRALVTVVLIVGLHGYFGSDLREALVFVGFALLVWLPAVRCPSIIATGAGILAESSLYIYLTHYQVYPLFGTHHTLGMIAAIAVGVMFTAAVTLLRRRHRERRLNRRVSAPAPALP